MEELLTAIGELVSVELDDVKGISYDRAGEFTFVISLKSGESVRLTLSKE